MSAFFYWTGVAYWLGFISLLAYTFGSIAISRWRGDQTQCSATPPLH